MSMKKTLLLAPLAKFSFIACGGATTPAPSALKLQPKSVEVGDGLHVMTMIPEDVAFTPKKIIGDNDLTPVVGDGGNLPSRYRDKLDAFGRLSMGCTATHIGEGFVLTAGHCFLAGGEREDMKACDTITVEWGVRRSRAPYMVSRCEMILAQETSEIRDYAILKVYPVPRAQLEVDLRPVAPGEEITMFGHPRRRPLEWSGFCQVLNAEEGGYSSFLFAHQCDTEEGNSGSTILANGSLKVIGVHGGGIEPYNYGTPIQNTPLAEFERYYLGEAELDLPDRGDRFVFDRRVLLDKSQDKLLLELGGQDGQEMVSFDLEVDIEDGFDFISILDGRGEEVSRVTGQLRQHLEAVQGPMQVVFNSDDSGRSKLVKISNVEYTAD